MSSFKRQRIVRPVTPEIPEPPRTRTRAPSGGGFFKKIILLVIVILALILIGGYQYIRSTGSIIIPSKNTYTIDKNTNLSNLNDRLDLGIDPLRYKLYIRLFQPQDLSIQAGGFAGGSGVTLEDFLTKNLQQSKYDDLTITILPGWNQWDIDNYLTNLGIIQAGEFISTARTNFAKYQSQYGFLADVTSLEGFLYPDTYRIVKNADADDAIHVMLAEFAKKIGPTYESLDPKIAYETLILASIVEREENKSANQPIVAGILKKRFDERIPLGADATVCYGYEKPQSQCTPSFIASVIYSSNPYNTRSTLGYPPTPIASVPLSVWNAALHPKDSPYYFYLHDADGVIHYGVTNADHDANRAKYLQ